MKTLWVFLLLIPLMQHAIAQNNVSGTVKSIPTSTPVGAELIAVKKFAPYDTTKAYSNPSTGAFSMSLLPGNYTLEADANHHYVWQDTAFAVNADTSLDLRLIKGQYDNGTNILLSPIAQHHGSILIFAEKQLERQNNGIQRHDVMNWASPRRRLYVTGITGQARANLDSVLALNETSPAGIYYDEQGSDSAGGIRIYGVANADTNLGGFTGYTDPQYKVISTNPVIQQMTGAIIYLDTSATLSKRIFSDELLHAEVQFHHSLWDQHVLTQAGTTPMATQTSPDEIYITAVNQALKLGDDWRKHKDTIKTIPDIIVSNVIVDYDAGWNMASVPIIAPSMLASAIFPEKNGSAFKYNGGYQGADTLENGSGYWIKLPSAITKEFDGTPVELDTIEVGSRWNIVGGIGYPVSKDSIEQIPSGILASSFFGYNGAYGVADTLQPGRGYWIKTTQPGKLVLKKPGMGANVSRNIPQTIFDTDMPDTPSQTTDVRKLLSGIQKSFTLSQNYPNPFNPITTIRFEIASISHTSLKIFNTLGQEVATLVNEIKQPGTYNVSWNTTNISSGIYFYRLTSGNHSITKKLVQLR